MKLSLSNLALPPTTTTGELAALVALGARGIEVAPTRIAPWEELDAARLRDYRRQLDDAGLAVSSLQALLFGTSGLHLLQDAADFEAMGAHLRKVAAIGTVLGAGIGVFGSPRNRLRGALEVNAAWSLGRARLRQLAEIVHEEGGFALGLEPVPAAYGGDYLGSFEEVVQMVREVDHPGLKVHLDTGCVQLGGGDIGAAVAAAGTLLGHFHIAEPQLGAFTAPKAEHAKAAAALHGSGYTGWCAIEMMQQAPDPMAAAVEAVTFAAGTYGAGVEPPVTARGMSVG